MPTAPVTVKGRHDRAISRIKREKRCSSVSVGRRDGSQLLRGVRKPRRFGIVRQAFATSESPFSILSSVVIVVALAFLAGCHVHGAGDLAGKNDGRAMVEEGGVTKSDAEQQVPEDTAVVLGNPPDTMISKGLRQGSVSIVPSEDVSWGNEQFASDAETRLIQEQMLLQGHINILDRQLRAFDTNPPSRSARDTDPRGRPEAVERRLDLERSMLLDQQRDISRELQRLRFGRSPLSVGPGLQGRSSQSLFGGSGLQ